MNSIHLDLLGTETNFYHTDKYTTRAIEVKNDKVPHSMVEAVTQRPTPGI